MIGDFLGLALNNLKRRKLRSWLTMVGIFIGIAAVVALISLGQGLQTAITGQFESMGTNYLTVENAGTGLGPPGATVVEKLNDHDVKVVEGIRGVKRVTPVLLRMGKIEYNDFIRYEMIRSVPQDPKNYEEYYKVQAMETEKGRLLKQGDRKKVVLGYNYLKKDKFNKAVDVGKRIIIGGEGFEIVGILESSGMMMQNDAVLLFYEDMEEIFDIDNEIEIIGVYVKESEDPEVVAGRIEKALRKDRDLKAGEEDFSVQTPLETISVVNDILNIVNIVVVGIAMISLIVGGIGIANTMYTSVLERKKEIGTMKAIGAKNSDILSVFLIESGLLGLVGGLIGAAIGASIALGVSIGANSFFGSEIIVVDVSVGLMAFAMTFSFLIGLISGLIPSYQASKLKPVEALRG